jgi:hypothetical protein
MLSLQIVCLLFVLSCSPFHDAVENISARLQDEPASWTL